MQKACYFPFPIIYVAKLVNYPLLAKKTGIYFAVGGGAGTLLRLSGRTWGRGEAILQNESKTGILLTRHFSGTAPESIILPPDMLFYSRGEKVAEIRAAL